MKEQATYRGFLAELLMAECYDRARRRSERRPGRKPVEFTPFLFRAPRARKVSPRKVNDVCS